MAEIVVEINRDRDRGTYRIKWSRGAQAHRPYHVKQKLISEHTSNLRAVLQELVNAGRDGQQTEYGALTRKLAQRGNALYEALFSGADGPDRTQADTVKRWVSGRLNSSEDRITFSLSSGIQIPWGLIYDESVRDDLGGPSPDPREFTHFWCDKYGTVNHYFNIPPLGTDTAWTTKSFEILFGANKAVWDLNFPLLDDDECEALHTLLSPTHQPLFDFKEIKQEWGNRQNIGHVVGLLTFYCHASGTSLCVGGEEVSATFFEQWFCREDASDMNPPTLVFLAGCQTAIGDLEEGFIDATGGPGYCGFIGTEVKVPDVFTLRFLTHFLAYFYMGGKTIGQIMQLLRQKHWPLSLVFSQCCPSDLKLEMRGEPHRVNQIIDQVLIKEINLSTTRISTAS